MGFKKNILQFRNFHEYLEAHAEELNGQPCLRDGERPGVLFTYAQLNEKINQTAYLLKKLGISKGDRFATLMVNCPEFFFLYLASMKMGSLIMPLVADLPLEGIVAFIKDFEVKVLIVDKERADIALEVKSRTKNVLKEVFGLNLPLVSSIPDFCLAISNCSKDSISFDDIRMEDFGSLYFSSGTTGEPKGIPQSPRNLLTAAYALAQAYGFKKDDTQMGILPNYHTALVTYGFWPSLCIGSNFVLFKKFSKTNFWKNIDEYKITFVEVVPTILAMLLNSPEDVSNYNLNSLKFIGSGSAPLSIELQHRFEETFHIRIANKYGLSETAPTHFNPPQLHLRKEGSIGKPLPMCEVKIFDECDKELKVGEIGEIVIRGDNVIDGYYQNPQANQEAFRSGWFHTGDLGYVDEYGFFFLVDRKKDIIIRGGAKIYPNEVDNVLFSHSLVAEAASFGIPDKFYGEGVIACVLPKKGCKLQEDELIRYCRQYLPEYKCPKRIYFVDNIPKTASGKVLRRKLTEMYNFLEEDYEIKR